MKQFFKEGLLGNIVSILLSLTIIMVSMYVYCGNEPILYIALMGIAVVIQVLVFSIYSFLAKKSMILRFVSVLGAFFCICALVVMAIRTGNNSNSVEFFIWFLSPQALVDFSVSYIIAIYIIINFFISSTIYYFSAVRYRIIMTFVITVIPFAFYRKEGEEVPVIFAFLLLMMYVALMIHCRHTNLKSNQKMVTDSGFRKSMVSFIVAASLLALIIPKPKLDIDNGWINTIFEYQKFTDYMFEKLGIVSDTAGSHDMFLSNKKIELFRVKTDEIPLHLKIQTFSNYDYKTNLWTSYSSDNSKNINGKADGENSGQDRSGFSNRNAILYKDSVQSALEPRKLYNAVAEASAKDSGFAEKYGFKDMQTITNKYSRKVSMSRVVFKSEYFFIPNLTYNIKMYPEDDPVFYNEDTKIVFRNGIVDWFSAEFYSQDIVLNADFNKFLKSIPDYETYDQLLSDTEKVLKENGISDYEDDIRLFRTDYLDAEDNMFSLDDVPDSIIDLAEKITENCNSPFEKAMEIEKYFSCNGFYYDISYERKSDFSMETLLFEDKRGICSDYATAAALLAGCAGIPSRYENGALVQEANSNGEYSVKDTDMHAYPEVFIPGYGWMVIEPTNMEEKDSALEFSISTVTLCLTIAAIVIIVLTVILLPKIKEKIFRKRITGSKRSRAFELIICRIRVLLHLEDSLTIEQISAEITSRFSEKYSLSSDMINEALYGGSEMSDKNFERIFSYYTGLYDIIKESKKRRNVEK